MRDAWRRIEAEAGDAFRGPGRFPLRAYSELMPPPYVGLKPYAPHARDAASARISEDGALEIDEHEQAHDLGPGLDWIAEVILFELGKLARGESHSLSRALLEGNPAWPPELAEAGGRGRLADDPLIVICALALSRTQDDKGQHRWTLFGASHDGPAAAFLHGLTPERLDALIAWAGIDGDWRILADAGELPGALHGRLLGDARLDGLRALVTFRPFARLPAAVRAAYLAGALALVPSPAALVFFEHPRYRELARALPRATQIPLLHLFPRVERGGAIRIPQSGWLDEPEGRAGRGHRIVSHLVRTNRMQRTARDGGIHGRGAYTDRVSVALFSTEPDAIGLYDKPLARNAQIWTEDYRLLLDGPRAGRDAIARAASAIGAGGRFGYRMYHAPMRAGTRELFWHLPVVARAGHGRLAAAPLGYVTAEPTEGEAIVLAPRLLARPDHVAAATAFERDPGRPRFTTSHNIRKLLEVRDQLGGPLAPSHARALLRVAGRVRLDDWIAGLPARAADRAAGARLAVTLVGCVGAEDEPGEPLVLHRLGTRAFEEQVWSTIAHFARGELVQKNAADPIAVNRGKHGGPAAKAARVRVHERRDLEALGDELHARYRELIDEHGMTGEAEVVDHVFRWETDFEFPWMGGWVKNQRAPCERNIVLVIPGRDRRQAVVMADHYDTAYMEDVYYPERGGDRLRAPARGADDNHSATAALLLAAEQLLPLARDGALARDVWLVHLTGEEFPADGAGARALCRGLVERHLVLTGEDGRPRDLSQVEVTGAVVVDMIGHNIVRGRDVFQIAPGEGARSARLALRAHRASRRWNELVAAWNRAEDRSGLPRARRVRRGKPPPPFAHLAVRGEIRVEWEPRSSLYNTDGQTFSDLGIPVVLLTERYDLDREGYHDTRDTMSNIDLDYCTALTAIAIETVADAACAHEPAGEAGGG